MIAAYTATNLPSPPPISSTDTSWSPLRTNPPLSFPLLPPPSPFPKTPTFQPSASRFERRIQTTASAAEMQSMFATDNHHHHYRANASTLSADPASKADDAGYCYSPVPAALTRWGMSNADKLLEQVRPFLFSSASSSSSDEQLPCLNLAGLVEETDKLAALYIVPATHVPVQTVRWECVGSTRTTTPATATSRPNPTAAAAAASKKRRQHPALLQHSRGTKRGRLQNDENSADYPEVLWKGLYAHSSMQARHGHGYGHGHGHVHPDVVLEQQQLSTHSGTHRCWELSHCPHPTKWILHSSKGHCKVLSRAQRAVPPPAVPPPPCLLLLPPALAAGRARAAMC